jgi:transposase
VREIEPLADLPVREPFGGELGDLQLLRGQRHPLLGPEGGPALAGGAQLRQGPLGPGEQPVGLADLVRVPQWRPRLGDAAPAAQPRAVLEQQARPVERPAHQVGLERAAELPLGVVLAGQQRARVEQRDPRPRGHAVASGRAERGQDLPRFVRAYRGCTFINAAAEYGQPDHPVRAMAIAQRRWVCETKEALLRQAGHPDPVAAARTLLALRTGYLISAALEEDAGWAEQFVAAYDRVVDAR